MLKLAAATLLALILLVQVNAKPDRQKFNNAIEAALFLEMEQLAVKGDTTGAIAKFEAFKVARKVAWEKYFADGRLEAAIAARDKAREEYNNQTHLHRTYFFLGQRAWIASREVPYKDWVTHAKQYEAWWKKDDLVATRSLGDGAMTLSMSRLKSLFSS